jgi:hypothetical protein
MGPKLVDYLLYDVEEETGILWIKFNRPERMNALIGTAEENGTVAKVGEYMRAGDDDDRCRSWKRRRPPEVELSLRPRPPGSQRTITPAIQSWSGLHPTVAKAPRYR